MTDVGGQWDTRLAALQRRLGSHDVSAFGGLPRAPDRRPRTRPPIPRRSRAGSPSAIWGWCRPRSRRVHLAGAVPGRLDGPDGWVVMFGVPPGVLYDPAGGTRGRRPRRSWWLPSTRSGARERPYGSPEPARAGRGDRDRGRRGSGPCSCKRARRWPVRGLEGDRYADGRAPSPPAPAAAGPLTLIEGEVLEELGLAPGGRAAQHRDPRDPPEPARGRALHRGWRGVRRPAAVRAVRSPRAARAEPGTLRALVHRGGLRADVLTDGEIAVGEAVPALAGAPLPRPHRRRDRSSWPVLRAWRRSPDRSCRRSARR